MSVIPIRGLEQAPKAAQSRMDTMILTQAIVAKWAVPPFQRPLRVNAKVLEVSEAIRATEVIEGVLTIGRVKGDPTDYIVDGQHRTEAYKLSGIPEAYADIRFMTFDNMAEMADEFVRLNSSLVKMRPDDILRGLEATLPTLATIKRECQFVGYGNVRRNGESGPVLSMSTVIRCWVGSAGDTPSATTSGQSAQVMAKTIEAASAESLKQFLHIAFKAWGRDPEYFRLWGTLNLIICMWLWRKLVIERDRVGNKRYVTLSPEEFKHGLMALSADADYLNWLPGRSLNDRDRSPAYGRIKAIFVRRLSEGKVKKLLLPQPEWGAR